MKLNKKTIFSVTIAIIFLSSILVVLVTNKGNGSGDATIIIDMGNAGIYKNKIPITENTSALKALSSVAYSIKVSNGTIECVADYCNTNVSHWEVYKLEGGLTIPINESLEKYNLEKGDTIVFKYVYY
jgi:hypothetical protein